MDFKTPRTNIEEFTVKTVVEIKFDHYSKPYIAGGDNSVVPSDFARTLEKEINDQELVIEEMKRLYDISVTTVRELRQQLEAYQHGKKS